MSLLERTSQLLDISGSAAIMRRYFVVNGFDGALTMLGLILGFQFSSPTELSVVINACLATAIALGVSGVSSAYVSEVAERRRELTRLEGAMITDLKATSHGEAARWVPLLVALVNGAAPLGISLLILAPLWLTGTGVALPGSPLYQAMTVACILIFLLGVLLGKIADVSWLRSGFRTLLIATATIVLIYLFTA